MGVALLAVIWATRTIMDHLSGGWFSFYCFKLPASHGLLPVVFIEFPLIDLGRYLPIALILAAVGLGQLFAASNRTGFYLHLAALVGMVAGSYTMRVHSGGWGNGLLPAYAEIAILAGVGFAMLERRFTGATGPITDSDTLPIQPRPAALLYASLLIQLGATDLQPVSYSSHRLGCCRRPATS